MTKQQHPITPPPELMYDWLAQLNDLSCRTVFSEIAQWGADQELEACCEWLLTEDYDVAPVRLRAARRPKPPSLKQQVLATLQYPKDLWSEDEVDAIRRLVEQLDD